MAKKRADGRYAVTKRINGKKYFFYGSTRKAAMEEMEKFTKQVANCTNYDGTITLTEWITRWYELKAPTITPSTLTSYKQVISRYIIPTIGNLKLVDVKVSTIRYLLQQFEHLSTRTQCYIYTMISI